MEIKNPSIYRDIMEKTEELVKAIQPTEVVEFDLGNGKKGKIINGKLYYDEPAVCDTLRLSTLTALIDYLKSDKDAEWRGKATTIRVCSPAVVELLTDTCGPYCQRIKVVEAQAMLPEQFKYGWQYEMADFVVALQSKFVHVHDWEKVAACCGSIKCNTGADYDDDGVTQRVTVQAGVSLAKNVTVPNPAVLAPYRTFCEIEQPASAFVLRVRGGKDESPTIALYEADGGAWKTEAMRRIKEYLEQELKDSGILILA